MKPELHWLAMTATMTGLFWLVYILNRAARGGLMGALMTPKMESPAVETEWAQRAKRGHANAVENLGVFTALVLVAHLAGVSNATTALAAEVYFFARLAHFIVLTTGLPYLRTAVWTAGWVAQMVIAWQVLAH